jgi:Uma2 family endonuclease
MTVDQFLAWSGTVEERVELHRGRVAWPVAMAGASANHQAICASLGRLCGNAVGGTPCKFLGQDARIVVQDTQSTFHPDGLIACPPRYLDRAAGTLDNPTVVFEVLSPSTESRDRTEKFDEYARLPSLRDYVLVSSQRPRVEVYSRLDDGSWALRVYLADTAAHVPSVDLLLPLSELFVNAVFDPAT